MSYQPSYQPAMRFAKSAFAPPPTNRAQVTDADGNVWNQISKAGFQREVDVFFWPAYPLDTDNFLGQLPPSVAEVAAKRSSYS